MLGALLAALPTTNSNDFFDGTTIEHETEDSYWANDRDRFEDWFLNGDAANEDTPDLEVYY